MPASQKENRKQNSTRDMTEYNSNIRSLWHVIDSIPSGASF